MVMTCAEKDYRTGWAVNRVLGIRLQQKEEMTRPSGKRMAEFSRFEFWDEEQQKTMAPRSRTAARTRFSGS